jgi:hypothetical protein
MRNGLTIFLVLAGLLSSMGQAWCEDEDQGFRTFGVRGGLSATERVEFFHQYEAFFRYGLPWSVRNESGWGVAMQLNGALGALHGGGETGFIGAVGPGMIISKAGGKGFALDIGGDLNFLSRDTFGQVDFNGVLLFDGHVGVAYRFPFGPGIGYRFQHMSNAGLNGAHNTGLDLHMVELSWNIH